MGFWFWFWIFAGIAIVALVIYGYLLWDLAARAKSMQAPLKKLEEIAKNLEQTQSEAAEIPKLVSALEKSEQEVLTRRKEFEKAKRKRKEERQRRLVTRLKDIDYDESRLQ